MKTFTPKFFPLDKVELKLTKEQNIIMKIGINSNGIIDYLVWNGKDYSWLEEELIDKIEEKVIGFNIELNT